ncbi:T9SS type A sorting domain-containing protein [Paraflavisolibacter sp. H34]|uniref:T9SS type A sorting domain-containing protein n=1 Tax=Huijunlia imazamoxiresistens TaxID=3127457 RepID=UPI003016C425
MKKATFFFPGLLLLVFQPSAAQAPPPDVTPPRIVRITRQNPLTEIAFGPTVTYRVVFSEKVRDVTGADFVATRLSGNVRGTLALLAPEPVGTEGTESVQPVGTTGTTYDVSVRAIAGTGALRLDLRDSTGITDTAGNALSRSYAPGPSYTINAQARPTDANGQQPAGAGFTSFTDLAPIPISSHTGHKPQSKVWTHAGKWWTVLPTYDGTKIFRLDGTHWTPVLKVANSRNSKADLQVVGNEVHILLFRGAEGNSYLVSVEYSELAGTYVFWTKRTQNLTLVFEPETETATLALDGNGRMWIASDGTSEVNLRWSDAPYTHWSAPIVIASGIANDDICAVTALPGKIGVLWSNQLTQRFGFRTHTTGADPALWTVDELPAAQSALNKKGGMADDHMNLVPAADGTLYCAVKTSYDSPGYPKVSLLVRRPNGTWDPLYPVTANEGTRPVVVLNEAKNRVKVVFSSLENGGDVLYRESALSPISFGPPITLLAGNYLINYTTTTRQPYPSEIVVLATSIEDSLQAVSVKGIDGSGSPVHSPTYITLTDLITGSLSHLLQAGSLSATPNPVTTTSAISYNFTRSTDYALSLYNSRGMKLALLKSGKAEAGRQQLCTLNTAGLSRGLYLVRIDTRQGAQTLKLLVIK